MARFSAIGIVSLAAIVLNASGAAAQTLGSAQGFAALGASTVTNTGPTILTGDLGVSPGSAITGFPPGIVNGTIHAADAVALQAQSDALLAYNQFVALGLDCDFNYGTAQELGGLVLTPGVHCFPSSAFLTGTLTLNGSGPFVFIIGSTLITASGSSVVVNDGNQTCSGSNVFWVVGSSATLGTNSQFAGTILALISITLTTGANLSGSALALTGAVTMDTNEISVCGSGGGSFEGAIKVTGGGQIPVPDPDDDAPDASGTGRATFGFNAQPERSGGAKGHFNYVNHVTGLHINGTVDDIVVIATNPDGSPKTVRFSGTCGGTCSFSVIVEDHGEPGTIDEFAITITGGPSEVRSQRVISRGNIQFHKK